MNGVLKDYEIEPETLSYLGDHYEKEPVSGPVLQNQILGDATSRIYTKDLDTLSRIYTKGFSQAS